MREIATPSDPGPTPAAPPGTQHPARAPVPRGRHARDRVLRAALEVLAEHGFSGFTMEAVAQRAHASKATVYRRWASSTELLADAVELAVPPFAPPGTGALRTDLIELVRGLQDRLTDQPLPGLLAAFVDATQRDPLLSKATAQLTERVRDPLRQVLAHARERGDIATTIDLELAVDLLGAPIFYGRLLGHQPPPTGYVVALVDRVLIAIGHTPPAPCDARTTATTTPPTTTPPTSFTPTTTPSTPTRTG